MLEKTIFSVPLELVNEARISLPNIDFKISLNNPTNRFFYDPWELKDEFKNTVWEKILSTIPQPYGEARLVQLLNGTCYMSHCDIDDRYHLNLEGQYSYLIDLDTEKMFKTVADGSWYVIDTGFRHVAANFGSIFRTQLVVRKLLNDVELKNPVTVKIFPICYNPRFEFDDVVSPWLHRMNKEHCLSEFNVLDVGVSFKLDQNKIKDLEAFPSNMFKVIIEK